MDAHVMHTPTPWVVSAPGIITAPKAMQDIGHVCYTGTDGGTDANAAFIVKACNAHDELVNQLQQAREWILEARSAGVRIPCENTLREINAALAKAGAA